MGTYLGNAVGFSCQGPKTNSVLVKQTLKQTADVCSFQNTGGNGESWGETAIRLDSEARRMGRTND